MGRGRGKGKKQTLITAGNDPGSGEEEKVPTYKRRGRPQKLLKDDIEEKTEKMENREEDGGNAKGSNAGKDVKDQATTENGRKRKRSSPVKENSVKDENGVGAKLNADDSIKSIGFRQNGSRRKNKPRRAAEVGVGCK